MTHNKMLIDASHPEETRVVVLRDGRVEEFDYESTAREQLRGNIYLAKVTRVEPSLQAAFVDYGGNRHGFLAFSEIHPDYYQIPIADRQALLEEEAEENERDASEDDAAEGNSSEDKKQIVEDADTGGDDKSSPEQTAASAPAEFALDTEASEIGADDNAKPVAPSRGRSFAERFLAPLLPVEYLKSSNDVPEKNSDLDDAPVARGLVEENGVEEVNEDADVANSDSAEEAVDEIGEGDALEEVPVRRRRKKRHYKIQEVIKRGQIILVQVVKEERGNKGAALTTYMSLAGRYTVLMPNTARGGGISRKITNSTDRNHLRKIANAIEVPKGMGLIIRTAGSERTLAQIERDFEYLHRLWEKVRDLTMDSIAPCRVYEEGDLIKRSIRDLYSTEIDSVVVAGEQAYADAHEFMELIMPSHAKNVELYKEPKPLFAKYDIERQLSAMFSPFVTLPSGGYLVINQTEALVAIDINSGKSTRNTSIEMTALNTNLEASEEIARQLKLRDLAGLIVIDYIDMEERSNNRSVERQLKQSLQGDRARIQVGRISHFGLLEMSRQRLRTGVLEGSTSPCAHCQGTGIIRSTESVALSVLRALEDVMIGGDKSALRANTSVDVALYILNSKRETVSDMEARYGVDIGISANDKLQGGNFSIERIGVGENGEKDQVIMTMNWGADAPSNAKGGGERKPRKRGGRNRNADSNSGERGKQPQRGRRTKPPVDQAKASDAGGEQVKDAAPQVELGEDGQPVKKPRRRGRRGGRRNRAQREASGENQNAENANGETGQAQNTENGAAQKADSSDEIKATTSPDAAPSDNGSTPGENTEGVEAKSGERKPRSRRSPSGRRPRTRTKPEDGANIAQANDAGGEASGDDANNGASVDNSAGNLDVQASSDDAAIAAKPASKPRARRRTPPKAASDAASETSSDVEVKVSAKAETKAAPEQKSASRSSATNRRSSGSTSRRSAASRSKPDSQAAPKSSPSPESSGTTGGTSSGPAKTGWWQKRD